MTAPETVPLQTAARPRAWGALARRGDSAIGVDLPACLRAAAVATVRRARLWPWERREVLRELCSHFAEGLEAGKTEDELMRSFGDPGEAGRRIGVAKRRGRSLVYRAAQGAAVAGVLLGAAYGGLAAWYFGAAPPTLAELRARLRPPVPEGQAAWPLYRAAILRLPKLPAAYFAAPFWADVWPGEPGFEEIGAYLEASAPALELIRQGATRPSLGAGAWDAELARHQLMMRGAEDQPVPPPDLGENPPLMLEPDGPAGRLRFLSWHVLADARLAIATGDAARFLADLAALVGTRSRGGRSRASRRTSGPCWCTATSCTSRRMRPATPRSCPTPSSWSWRDWWPGSAVGAASCPTWQGSGLLWRTSCCASSRATPRTGGSRRRALSG